ncbi:MAG: sigma-70 family RNA polymerase sigma factor [Polyangiaceae bacterium]|nr:sigma-70 family RNA polymerase sigma factor [Polyangiaceae bacterium]
MSSIEAQLIRDPEALLMVREEAKRIHRRYPFMKLEDLIALGHLGMVKAMPTYDRNKGASFGRYSWRWARGEMMDAVAAEVKNRKAVSAQHRGATAGVYRFSESACAEATGRGNTPEERLKALQELTEAAMAAGVLAHVGQATKAGATGGEAQAIRNDLAARVHVVLDGMPAAERELLERHYWHEADLKDLIEPLDLRNIAEARRAHRRALLRLSVRLRGAGVTADVLQEFR